MGFKAGSIVLAQTAVVLTWVVVDGTRTLSIGVLSNEPYEARSEEPIRLFATLDTKTDTPTGGSTDEEYDAVMAAIKRVNKRLSSTLCAFVLSQLPPTSPPTNPIAPHAHIRTRYITSQDTGTSQALIATRFCLVALFSHLRPRLSPSTATFHNRSGVARRQRQWDGAARDHCAPSRLPPGRTAIRL